MQVELTTGRREANKARTRRAIVEAVYRLLASHRLEELTAEQVADAAEVSRRTFFNYFPSVEAVLAHREQEVLDQLRRTLNARPAGESLVDSLHAVIEDLFTVEMLTEAVHVWRATDGSRAATRFALEAKEEALAEIGRDWAGHRLQPPHETGSPAPDPLRANVLTASCMAAFDTARRSWLADHAGPVDRAGRDAFVARVHRAFEVLRPAVDQLPATDPAETGEREH